MGLFFGGVILAIGLVILLTGIGLRQSENKFEQKSIRTRGVIVSYYQQNTSSIWDTPVVKAIIDGREVKRDCRARKINAKVCPINTEVKISYIEKKLFGKPYYSLKIDEEDYRPISSALFGNGLIIFSLILLGIGAILMAYSL